MELKREQVRTRETSYHTQVVVVVVVSCSVVSDSLRPHGALEAPLSKGFSRQEYWSGLPFPSPGDLGNRLTELKLGSKSKEKNP